MKKETKEILKSSKLDLSEYTLIESIYVDPATVITIAETGYKIYNMFKRKKTGPSQELIYLKKIYAEIRDMQNDLNMIINLLYDLKIYIDQKQIEYIANVLSSKINTVNLFLIGWLENGKGNLEEQFASIHETKHLLGNYGFAHIHVYMLAFRKELDLCYWLKKGPIFTKVLLEDSHQYFTDALNPLHPLNTPAKKLSEIYRLMEQIKTEFVLGDFSQNVTTPIKATGNNNRDGYKKALYLLNISGNIDEGFVFTISEKILEIKNPWYFERRGDPPHGGGGGGHIQILEKSVFAINSEAQILDAKIVSYNQARELYLHYRKSKLELESTIYTIKQLLEIIKSWSE